MTAAPDVDAIAAASAKLKVDASKARLEANRRGDQDDPDAQLDFDSAADHMELEAERYDALLARIAELEMYCREAAIQADGMAKVCEKYADESGITGALSRTMKETIETAAFMQFVAEGGDGAAQWESEIKKRVDSALATARREEREAALRSVIQECEGRVMVRPSPIEDDPEYVFENGYANALDDLAEHLNAQITEAAAIRALEG